MAEKRVESQEETTVPKSSRFRAEMPVVEHLLELRYRIFVSISTFTAMFIASLFIARRVIDISLWPLPEEFRKLAFMSPSEPFMVYVKISVILGLVLASPVILYQIWAFILPALEKGEIRSVLPIFPLFLFLFIAGASFSYFVIIPPAIRYLSYFWQGWEAVLTFDKYFSFFTGMVLAGGILFEFPILMFILAKFGLITESILKRYWKHSVVAILFVAAVITPSPDIFSMLLLSLPLFVLYLSSFLIVRNTMPVRNQKNSE